MAINEQQWKHIRKFWGDSSHATLSPSIPYCALATVDEDGSPRMAPCSSLILGENQQGTYFNEFSRHMTRNLERNSRISVLLVNNRNWFWLKAVLLGKFDYAPGIRLVGRVGKKRTATLEEINSFKKPLKPLRIFKGYQPLWGAMKHVREIHFESFETVKCGSIRFLANI